MQPAEQLAHVAPPPLDVDLRHFDEQIGDNGLMV
jgi:hypothetical protein